MRDLWHHEFPDCDTFQLDKSLSAVSRNGLERRAMTKAWFNELLRNEREWEDTTMASSDPNFCHRSERTRWNDSRWWHYARW